MARMMKFNQSLGANGRIDINDDNGNLTHIEADSGDLILKTKTKEISVNSLIERLEALETAYMEDKLLGKQPGKIE